MYILHKNIISELVCPYDEYKEYLILGK